MLVCMCCSRWRHQPTWHENLLYGHIGVVLRKSWPPVELRLELIAILRMDQLQRTLVDDVGLSGERWQMGEMCCIVLIMCHISGGVGGRSGGVRDDWWLHSSVHVDTKKHLMQFIIYSNSYVTPSALYQRWLTESRTRLLPDTAFFHPPWLIETHLVTCFYCRLNYLFFKRTGVCDWIDS